MKQLIAALDILFFTYFEMCRNIQLCRSVELSEEDLSEVCDLGECEGEWSQRCQFTRGV